MKKKSVYVMSLLLVFCFAKVAKSVCLTPTFDTLPALTVNRPLALAPGDFNRDGKPDLAILRDSLSPNGGLVQIWLGNSAGSFAWTGVDYSAVESNVVGITVAELNQDGLLDLAVVGGPSSNYVVAVLFGNGNGGFSTPTSFPIGSDPEDIATADFNNDGKIDIVTADFNGRVAAILPNNGNGNFGTAITIPTGITGGSNPAPIAIVTGSFNGDNNPDFLTVNNNDTVSVKLGNGNFTFSNPPTVPSNLAGSQQDIEIGDFNRDGVMDLATASYSASAPGSVVNIRLGAGSGLFSVPTPNTFPVTTSANHLAVADLNADGKPDIASANNGSSGSNNLTILLNADAGNFSGAYNFTAEVGRSEKVYAVDFDHNRSPDLLVLKEVGDNKIVRLKNTCTFPKRSTFDYEGDGKSDISVFRPSTGAWYLQQSQNGFFGNQFGLSTDRIVPADYDGDGKTDIAVYRPSNGFWYITNSSNGAFSYFAFGLAEDLPTPADYDGDGKADLSVFRPSTGTWYRQNSSDGVFVSIQFGLNGDKPTVGDFDDDGKSDIAVFRPSNGSWYRLNSSNGSFFGVQFGISTDLTVPGDYDGDNKTDIAVYRPSNGFWYVLSSLNGAVTYFNFGLSFDIPAQDDFDGDGKVDICVFRPSDGKWYRQNSSDGSFVAFQFGSNGDRPTQAAFRY
ncbi:MAG: VCBS repeat-containing protein [Chloracidobacterium sp.]|nr:VCBS repeat-containing protein [Chloracidobacterium sp.]